ncbi:MAG TPA: hypothetical protein VNY36_02240, partial [Bacteroidia bacterium]|nr:hypothetical protein [Bacteroidia bacterium]
MRRLLIAFFFIASPFFLINAQNIYTIAGNGTGAYKGDGGQATDAELSTPSDVTMDNSGNYYITDYSNNRIRIVNSAGIITTFVGNGTAGYSGDNGPATAAELNHPVCSKTNPAGFLDIADTYNNRIRRVNATGTIITFAGNGIKGYSGDGGPASAAELNSPEGVTVDGHANIYIADNGNNRVRIVNTTGIITTFAGNGIQGYSGDGGLATAAELNNPIGLGIGDSGKIYIADVNNNCIRVVNSAGIITTFAGNGHAGYIGDGGPATAAELNYPAGVKSNNGTNIFITDQKNNCI